MQINNGILIKIDDKPYLKTDGDNKIRPLVTEPTQFIRFFDNNEREDTDKLREWHYNRPASAMCLVKPREILINHGYSNELVSQWDNDYCKEELEEFYSTQLA